MGRAERARLGTIGLDDLAELVESRATAAVGAGGDSDFGGLPLHTSNPLVASFLLLVGLAKVELGDHQRKAIWRASVAGLAMLLVGGLVGACPI